MQSENKLIGWQEDVGNPARAEQPLTPQRVLAGLWRRKLLVLAVAGAVGVAGAAAVVAQPNVYRALAVMRVEPQRMSADLVTPSVTQIVEDRLKTVREELFSRPILQRVIQDVGLYPDLVKSKGIDAAVEEMRRHLDVHVDGDNAFELSFEGTDPKVAAAVANRLPELFAEETLQVREQQATDAQDLFGDELAKITRQVVDQEAKISAFKVAHLGELPEQLEANMRGLERLTALLGEKTEALRDAQRRQADATQGRFDANSQAGRLGKREDEVNTDLATAKSQWTADHPEVQRLEREAEAVHARRTQAEHDALASDTARAVASSQVGQIQREMASIQAQADDYRKRIDATPTWSMPLAELDRSYDVLKTKYGQMVSRKVEADVAHDLELRARTHMFHVLSPAVAPAIPVRPDRVAGAILVALLALGMGVLVGTILEMRDDSLRVARDAHDRLRLPVLAAVPTLGSGGVPRPLRPAVRRQVDA